MFLRQTAEILDKELRRDRLRVDDDALNVGNVCVKLKSLRKHLRALTQLGNVRFVEVREHFLLEDGLGNLAIATS